ncbi:MAG: hypothetical protein CM1200mP16_13530 [Nitrospina sp.]|nr:MAG: hypothetical protein CM1200mP16_13530 [Nitrospina sp.]
MDLSEEKLHEVGDSIRKKFQVGVAVQVLNVVDEEAVRQSFSEVVEDYGGVDFLISNAGNALQGEMGKGGYENIAPEF